jgi:NADPH-dependent 2,4-dienoyl-CoA reductase/sulfur reductase-like enzyme
MNEVVIVGGSLAGLRAAEALRSGGFAGRVTIVGAETHLPYDRPPLSKRLLSGEWEPDRIVLRKADDMATIDVGRRLGTVATGLDLRRRSIALDDGDEIGFDGLVVATGAAARLLPGQGDHGAAFVLRTLDDAVALRAHLLGGGRRVVVVGAGFIGLEAAATARQLGNDVIVVEGGSAPLVRGLGAEMGAAVAGCHADHGVEIRCGVSVDGFEPGGVVVDGVRVPADVVVVGIGVVPSIGWLDGSGLELRDGLVCGPDLNAGAPLVYGAGDVARWRNPLFDEEMRVEHWTNAAEQGALAAANLLAEATGAPTTSYAPVPFFWSEQYDRRIQFLGRASTADGVIDEVRVVAGSTADRRFAGLYRRGDRLGGVLGMNMPRQVMPFRSHLAAGIGWDEALEVASRLAT